MKKLFTLLCVALVSAVGFAQDAYDPTAHKAVVSGTDNLCTANWGGPDGGDAMTYDATDGLWKVTLSAKDTAPIEFKIVYDGEWYGNEKGGNYRFQVEEASDVLITFDPTTLLASYKGDKVKEFGFTLADVEYIIATGSGALFNGVDWKITEEEAAINKMTAEDEGYYTIELKDIAAGSYIFKFAANGSWASQWGAIKGDETIENGVAKAATMEDGQNFSFTLEKGAVYDVTLTLDLMNFDKPMVTAEWKATGEAEIEEDVYSLAGTFNEWNQKDESTELTKVSEGVYSISRPVKAGEYKFKVVKNHDWGVAYPADDYVLNLEEDADVTITLDLNNTETPVTVTTAECSVYFVDVTAKASKREHMYIYACYGEAWNKLTGDWPGEEMNFTEAGYVLAEELPVPKGETLQIIFSGDGGQTSDIKLGAIKSNLDLVFTVNDDWTYELPSAIQTVAADKTNGVIFNLAGQRVQKAVRGLYIINGKKVVK